MIEELMNELIFQYTRDKKKVEPRNKELENFMQFYLEFLEGLRDDEHKYIHYRTLGLALINQNKSQFYKRIREGIRIIHNRGKNNQGFFTSEAFRSRRRWPRRLV